MQSQKLQRRELQAIEALGRANMQKLALGITIAFSIWAILEIPALAQQNGTRQNNSSGGYCPAGTCGKGGGSFANNMKNCSAANCRK